MPQRKSFSIDINDRKKVNITWYNKQVYVHFNEKSGSKSITFNRDEFRALYKNMDKILKCTKSMEKDRANKKSNKTNKKKSDTKKHSYSDHEMSSSSDDSTSDDES